MRDDPRPSKANNALTFFLGAAGSVLGVMSYWEPVYVIPAILLTGAMLLTSREVRRKLFGARRTGGEEESK